MVTPYLTFRGNCREALLYYQAAFGNQIEMMQTYGDYVPKDVPNPPADLKNWILHAEMTLCSTRFWFADEVAQPVEKGTMVKLTATVDTANEAQRIFDSLSAGAQVTLPPTDTFYSAFHAGLIDRYGVCWNIVAQESPARQ